MRTSERLAAGAVVAMTMPAFLAFPALGLWYVVKVWPGMTWVDRGIFCVAFAAFCAGLPYSFRRGTARLAQGIPSGLTASERMVIWIPIVAGEWALTHRVDMMVSTAFVIIWDVGPKMTSWLRK